MSTKIEMPIAMTSSNGIMTLLAFSMPFFTPRATTPMQSSMNTIMNTYVKMGSVMNETKNPSTATAPAPSAM